MEYSYRVLAGGFQNPRCGRIEALDVWGALDHVRAIDVPARINSATVLLAWPVWNRDKDRYEIAQQEFILAMVEGHECWTKGRGNSVHGLCDGL